jgi:hypothetical protein
VVDLGSVPTGANTGAEPAANVGAGTGAPGAEGVVPRTRDVGDGPWGEGGDEPGGPNGVVMAEIVAGR